MQEIYNILWMMWQNRRDDFYNLITSFYKPEQIQTKNLFGIRFENQNDSFDDIIGLFETDVKKITIIKGTTEPGIYYTMNPMNKNGGLRLAIGFHKKLWTWGWHRSKYYTLVQRSACNIVRDSNQNQISDEDDKKERGYFGCNFHPQGYDKLEILKSSAGCQVPFVIEEWKNFRDICQSSGEQWFNYMLLHENNFSEL